MLYEMLSQAISVLGTVIAVLAVRYLMELSTPAQDWYVVERWMYGMRSVWRKGFLDSLIVEYRFRKLMDFEPTDN